MLLLHEQDRARWDRALLAVLDGDFARADAIVIEGAEAGTEGAAVLSVDVEEIVESLLERLR